ncbi:hypothetical protein EXE51_08045 [Halorubrum sp. CGM5_25_10-8B]|uniref:hypothetical protein n=1 Tax=Halorubrum sp. CGM5_25_10-8B TaxID=2518115 RepID=UPI0010F7492C|nr:hypothetical protein [Halorubrum sp. CGM5_25_10-8B]TKX37020.1 hypothetical protein EXE51_08045 [Halorubrum sp. CGM5_25_10-8B]
MSQNVQKPSTGGEMPRHWDDDEVDHFITSEAHTAKKTPEQFRETHVDIDRIYADTLTPLGISGDFVTQEDVLNSITASTVGGPDSDNDPDPNRIFIVRGEPGSGKSQFCEWTKYQINGYGEDDEGIEDYVALHVSRSQTRMDQIIEVLTEPLDVDRDVRNIEGSDPYELAEPIVGLLRGYWSTDLLTDEELRELTEERSDGPDLRDIFAKNIQEYQDALNTRDKNPDFSLLTRKDYREIHLSLDFGDKLREEKELIFPALKNQAHEYLSKNLVGDFKEQLQEYSELYQEKGIRPVLICEDLTTFSVLKEQLLDHIFELSSSHYDIVLGWTIGWEQENIDDAMTRSDAATYMKGRSEGYLTMTDENGEAYFLDDDASVELTRSYLNAIKRHSSADAAPDNVEDAFDGLYPFNERFVHVAYRQLNDEGSGRKTPRLLLLRVVKHCLKSTLPPYEAMKSNSFVDRPMLDIGSEYQQVHQDISRWYGVSKKGGVGVQKGIFEAFDVTPPGKNVEESGEYIIFEKGQWSGLEKKINPDLDEREVKSDDDAEDGGEEDGDEAQESGETEESKERDETEEEQGSESDLTEEQREKRRKVQEFQDWVTNGEEYPSSDTLHEGAVEALERWHEPTRLGNPNASTRYTGGIYYTSGDEIPVSIQGDQQRQASIDIELEWGAEHANLYTSMLEYGLFGTFDSTDTNFDQLRAWADNNVAQFKREMREEIEDALPSELDIEKTLVLAQFFLINAADGVEEDDLSTELLFRDYDTDCDYENPVGEHFDKNTAFGQAFSGLATKNSDVSDLVEGFFLLKEKVVDYNRLSEARREVTSNFEDYVDAAMMIDGAELPAAYKVGTTRRQAGTSLGTYKKSNDEKITGLLDRISNYAAELQRLTTEEDASHIQETLEPVERWYDSSHTVNDLAGWFETLHKCAGAMDVPIKSSYEDAYETLTESREKVKLTDFQEDVERFQNMDDVDGVTLIVRLHDFARSQHEQAAWEIYEALDSLIDDLQDQEHSTGVDLEHRVRQLSEFTEYEQKRQEITDITENL